jgi:hypothetical protein
VSDYPSSRIQSCPAGASAAVGGSPAINGSRIHKPVQLGRVEQEVQDQFAHAGGTGRGREWLGMAFYSPTHTVDQLHQFAGQLSYGG